MLNLRTGKFLAHTLPQQEGQILANFIDSKAMYDYFDQKEVEDLTRGIAQLVATADSNIEEASFLDRLEDGAQRFTTTKSRIEYRLRGRNKVHFRVTQATVNPTPGLRFTSFYLRLNTNVFKPGDRISPVMGPLHQCVIQGHGRPVGDSTEYKVQYSTNNPNAFFPLAFLERHERWEVAGSSVYGENSEDWGSTIMMKGHSVLRFRVPLFKTGKELKLTDEAIAQGMVVATESHMVNGKEMPDPDGVQLVSLMAEAKFRAEIRMQKDQDMTWGVSSDAIQDTSSDRYRHIGAGVFDFARDGHVKRYSTSVYNTSIEEFTDFLDPIFDLKSPAQSRVMFETGKPGMELADELIKRKHGENSAIRDIGDFLERIGQSVPGGTDAFKLKKPAFKAYELPTYGLVEFNHWSALDNKAKGGPNHPRSGKPIMAYWMVAFDVGYGTGAGSNIAFVQRENATIWAYQANAWSFDGPINDQTGSGRYRMVSGARNAILRHGDEYGLFVKDLNKMVWFLPNIKY